MRLLPLAGRETSTAGAPPGLLERRLAKTGDEGGGHGELFVSVRDETFAGPQPTVRELNALWLPGDHQERWRGSARVEPVVMPPSTRSVWPVI